MEFTPQERIDNLEEMIIQYMEAIFGFMEKIMDMLETRGDLISELKNAGTAGGSPTSWPNAAAWPPLERMSAATASASAALLT
jgi:hypothetical protein